jgi:hypothetical protein
MTAFVSTSPYSMQPASGLCASGSLDFYHGLWYNEMDNFSGGKYEKTTALSARIPKGMHPRAALQDA